MPLGPVDKLEILDLLARYNHALDAGDVASWVRLWAGERSLTVSAGTFVGEEQLAAFASGFHETYPGARHHCSNLVIDGDDDHAQVRCYLVVIDTAGEPSVLATGRYDDQLLEEDQQMLQKIRAL